MNILLIKKTNILLVILFLFYLLRNYIPRKQNKHNNVDGIV
jgi:hypothetical protein